MLSDLRPRARAELIRRWAKTRDLEQGKISDVIAIPGTHSDITGQNGCPS